MLPNAVAVPCIRVATALFYNLHNSDMNSLILLQSLPSAVNKAVNEVSISRIDMLLDKLLALSLTAGKRILVAALIYMAGRFIIKIINRVVSAMLSRRHVDVGVQSFLRSLVHILLTILLVISVISALGINTTSFAALLASAGVAVGMALSGNLQILRAVWSYYCSSPIAWATSSRHKAPLATCVRYRYFTPYSPPTTTR